MKVLLQNNYAMVEKSVQKEKITDNKAEPAVMPVSPRSFRTIRSVVLL
jgi:hypothetical protein